jgi:sulfatase-like protein
MKRFYYLKDVATALSLSNLFFLAVWQPLLSPQQSNGYYVLDPSLWRNSAAVMLDVLLLAAAFWGAYSIARRQDKEFILVFARWGFLLAVYLALDGVRRQFYGPLTAPAMIAVIGKIAFIALLVIGILLTVFVLVRCSRQVISFARAVVLILSPFVLVTFSQAAWALVRSHPGNTHPKDKSAKLVRPATRVVWLIFDEFDYRVPFVARPSSVELPQLDRLRGESIVATNAYPPSKWTVSSLPALITGRLVSDARSRSDNELMLTFDGASEAVGWSTQPNIFSRTQAIGGTTAVVGWYHPYCRVLGGDLTKCSFEVIHNQLDFQSQSVSQSMFDYFRTVTPAIPPLHRAVLKYSDLEKKVRYKDIERLKRISQVSTAAVADASISLTLIHFPAPHDPYLYDGQKDDFSYEGGCTYFDNLELVDRTLGELRDSMERAGVWDDAVVLVSSDHWWRIDIWPKDPSWTEEEQAVVSGGVDYRVPFLVKLKSQKKGTVYHPSFNTILSQYLILALLQGELSTSADVTSWLDRHRSIDKSPYYK